MSEQISTMRGLRGELTEIKNNLFSYRVRQCLHRAGRLRRFLVGVNTNATEVMLEAWLEKAACFNVHRPARRVQHIVNDGWRRRRARRVCGFALQFLFLARFALSTRRGLPATSTLTLEESAGALLYRSDRNRICELGLTAHSFQTFRLKKSPPMAFWRPAPQAHDRANANEDCSTAGR